MVGNDQGLSFVDAMAERFERLENEIASMKKQMTIIRSSELLKYLLFEKQVNSYERNESVHGGQVMFDIQYLDSVDESSLHDQGLTKIDVEMAFEKRYGKRHEYFRSRDFPPVIERIINKRSALEHLRIWKDLHSLGQEYVDKCEKLKLQCDRTIRLWFQQTQKFPYSIDDANSAWDKICKEHKSTLDSIQHTKREDTRNFSGERKL